LEGVGGGRQGDGVGSFLGVGVRGLGPGGGGAVAEVPGELVEQPVGVAVEVEAEQVGRGVFPAEVGEAGLVLQGDDADEGAGAVLGLEGHGDVVLAEAGVEVLRGQLLAGGAVAEVPGDALETAPDAQLELDPGLGGVELVVAEVELAVSAAAAVGVADLELEEGHVLVEVELLGLREAARVLQDEEAGARVVVGGAELELEHAPRVGLGEVLQGAVGQEQHDLQVGLSLSLVVGRDAADLVAGVLRPDRHGPEPKGQGHDQCEVFLHGGLCC